MTTKPTISFLGLVLTASILGSAAHAEFFTSYILDVKYDSVSGKLVDTSYSIRKPKLLAQNPEIKRMETKEGLQFVFGKDGKEILKIKVPFVKDQHDDEFIAAIEYNGKVSTALASLSLIQAPHSKKELCARAGQREKFQLMLKSDANRLSFKNQGGLGADGVCWWFSRFERNATYLAVFRPDLPKPSRAKAVALISQLRAGSGIVEIPGFENLDDFSSEYQKEIQSALDSWQVSDGVFGFGFLNGLKGSSKTTPAELEQQMNLTYAQVVREKRLPLHILQMPGYDAHAWLVVGMEKTKSGYRMQIADSNFTENVHLIDYVRGATHLEYSDTDFVPYLNDSYSKEEDRVLKTLKKSCGL